MAKIAFILAAFVAVALAEPPKAVPIVEYTNQRTDDGQYDLKYVSGDGTIVTSKGVLKPTADGKDNVLVYTGSYQYTAPDGAPVSLSYVADVDGFRVSGTHVPQAPLA
ncbi:endocuticle structural glycoprotein SgAbd-2-like [Cephus cinctus]|uniref:Endocuticle structural glycoprotein SgAbd-2-like n=1 Tax=Cephus cinctus TaxID=211228 RepID=A0AAJ7RKA1_CEPCN|nr:endocuticle structural glycoprotein SgAbd-2-like [Cephus cinctus]